MSFAAHGYRPRWFARTFQHRPQCTGQVSVAIARRSDRRSWNRNCRELCPVYAFAIQKCSRNFGLEREIHVLWNIPGEPGDAHGVEFGRYNSDQVAARVN